MSAFTVYVLFSVKHQKIYIGFTTDLQARLRSHNELATKGYTVKYRPWILIHTKSFATKKEALIREKQLKGGQGRSYIWKLIREQFSSDSYHS